jgi:hypothetical protein
VSAVFSQCLHLNPTTSAPHQVKGLRENKGLDLLEDEAGKNGGGATLKNRAGGVEPDIEAGGAIRMFENVGCMPAEGGGGSGVGSGEWMGGGGGVLVAQRGRDEEPGQLGVIINGPNCSLSGAGEAKRSGRGERDGGGGGEGGEGGAGGLCSKTESVRDGQRLPGVTGNEGGMGRLASMCEPQRALLEPGRLGSGLPFSP